MILAILNKVVTSVFLIVGIPGFHPENKKWGLFLGIWQILAIKFIIWQIFTAKFLI